MAFLPGYDPALELANHGRMGKGIEDGYISETAVENHMRRREQDLVDRIIQGEEPGHYFFLMGPKVRFFAYPV